MRNLASLERRDRRALVVLGCALVLAGIWKGSDAWSTAYHAVSPEAIEALEQRHLLARDLSERQSGLDDTEVASLRESQLLEGRLLQSATTALAQAELRSIVTELLGTEGIDLERSTFEAPDAEAPYLTIPLGVVFTCQIDQFVAFMAGLANAEPILATRRLEVGLGEARTKAVRVNLTVEGYLRPADGMADGQGTDL